MKWQTLEFNDFFYHLEEDLCEDKQCGEVCDTSMGMLHVMRFCQPDGSCGMNSAPNCKGSKKYLV